MVRIRESLLWILIALSACGFLGATFAAEVDATQLATEFDRLLFLDWQQQLDERPLFASDIGDSRGLDRFPEIGVESEQRRNLHDRTVFERLAAIDPSLLSEADQVDYRIFRRIVETRLAEFEHKTYLIPITSRDGFHVAFAKLPERTAFSRVMDYRNYVARLLAFRRYVGQHIDVMREGIRLGYVLPRVALEGWEDSVETHIVDKADQSRLYSPFVDLPDSFRPDLQEFLRKLAREAIEQSVVPGYRDFERFMREEYVPAARSTVGASALPGGAKFYAYRVRRFTTLELSAEEIHKTGLAEVARIRNEMLGILKRVQFQGDFAAFLEFLRTDDRFYAKSPDELLDRTSRVLKKMDGQLPRFFGNLPRMPYGIREVPAFIAPRTTTAYYDPPAGDGTRAGFYNVNTYDLRSRPLYEIEALSFHEAVPGHHLQIALAQELQDVRPFRRYTGFTAFVEGWALYAERLGLEAGFYQDPYSDFGRLTYEMWRACRLVIDTGLHSKDWTRKRAIEFMVENTALSLRNIENEVDRYISWPGQALCYKIGELRIRELRARAEQTLGARFDLRAFHDALLEQGAVPLDIAEARVDRWVRETLEAE